MATVTTRIRSFDLGEAHRRVRSPLERLAGYIRLYVALEGLALLCTFLAVWFWFTLLMDFGFFKIFGLDWVQDFPRWARALALGTYFASVVGLVQFPALRRAFGAGGVVWRFQSLLHLFFVDRSMLLLGGGLAFVLYVVAWKLVGLAADNGIFGPAITGIFIALLLLGPAAFLAAKRLFHDFSDRALALVLERRFPKVLGDRLITAVELSNPQEAVKFGYSPAMIEETIHEAAQRVEKLPLGEVFDWQRLKRHGVAVLIVTLGCYVAAGGAFALGDAIAGNEGGLSASFGRFHDVAAIWAERNLLLENTIWPRRAHLEFLDQFAEVEALKVGRDNANPTVKVRALRWVVADRAAPEGWRAMYWDDLNEDLLGDSVPDAGVPADWAVRDPARGVSIDEIEIRLNKPATHATLDPRAQSTLRDLLAKLEERAKLPAMSRRFRMLTIPDIVYVNYSGGITRSEMTLKPINDNEYEGQFPDLKESITFRARGEDYYTPTKRVVVVPPPSLISLIRDEYHPAYLYYRGKPEDLRGKKQVRRNLPVSLFGGDVSNIDLPAGSDVVLTATTDKELQPDQVRILSADDKKPLVAPEVTKNAEGKYKIIRVRFDDIRYERKFYFEFVDTDNVVGRRHVRIRPQEDLPPDLEVTVETLRKTPQGYMVTPLAQVPFAGFVRDDRGLDGIEFVYALSRSDPAELGGRPLLMVGAMHMIAGGMGHDLLTAACLATLSRDPKTEGDGKGKATLRSFTEKLARETLPWDEVLKLLDEDLSGKNAQRALLKEFKFDAEDRDLYFDLVPADNPLGEAVRYPGRGRLSQSLKADEGQRQPRYRLQLSLEATDTDILTGPHRGQSKERFNFFIVPEEELIGEIAKEEENHHVKLEEAVRRLREAEGKLTQMKLDLAVERGVKKEQFGNMSLRSEEIEQVLEKTQTTVNEVHADYKRILEELYLNRIQTVNYVKNIEDNIVAKLREAIETDYPDVEKATKEMHRSLDVDEADLLKKTTDARAGNDAALAQLAKLIKRLDDVLASMEKLTNVNKLIAMLLKIQEGLLGQDQHYRETKDELEKRLFRELEAPQPEKKPAKKP